MCERLYCLHTWYMNVIERKNYATNYLPSLLYRFYGQ